ncbi:asparagine synthase-related protein [Natronosalvus vescus]|uniref:asparagine synthase-related protein n=1 Tax=Natronosalvus vescus TaxID=2953881 RepID=UPI0020910F5D|nr:asparagine synthase-related protein [Natronosalvus vescus]
MQVALHHEGWVRFGGVAVRGRAFEGDSLLEAPAIAARFARVLESGTVPSSLEAVADCAAGLEGFFAAIVDLDGADRTYLVADGARSIPLYYDGGGEVVSDRGRAVRESVDAPRDPITEREFLLTRYVTGPETIWRGVFAVQPGEVVELASDDGAGDRDGRRSVTRRSYREYWPAANEAHLGSCTDDDLSPLEAGLETALERLEAVAGDRPVVLPLSGGFDSRLLAAALVERGREVIAFTFGRSGHPDVEVSREVAAELGIRWEFYPYSRERWREWYHGEAGRRYRGWAFGGDALPFLAEWPAVRGLLEAGRLPEDALYCPGHTVATPSERLPRFVGEEPSDTEVGEVGCGPAVDADDADSTVPQIEPTVEALTEYILERHYALWEWEDAGFRRAARERIRRGLLGDRDANKISSPETAAAAYERWEWRGRMSTFTNGDLRVYEDAGLEWWLPLWDPAYVRAWESIPLADRRGKRLHADLATAIYWRVAGVPHDRAALTDRTLEPADRFLSLVRHTPAHQFTERDGDWEPAFLAPRSNWRKPGSHPLAWDGAVDDALLEAVPASRNFYALRTLSELGWLDLAEPSWLPQGEKLPSRVAESVVE